MGGFISWVLSILAVVIIGTVLDMFLSEKKLGKVVRGVFASLTVLIIVSPLPTLFNGCKNFEQSFIPQELNLDEGYLNYANSQKTDALEKGLEAALKDSGYSGVNADITAEFSTQIIIKLVRLDISGLVMDKSKLNINKIKANIAENIRSLAAEFLMISKDAVLINE